MRPAKIMISAMTTSSSMMVKPRLTNAASLTFAAANPE
jgi:hypothetical protein